MDIEFHKGMSSSGKLYGFGLLWMRVLSCAGFAESLETAVFELSKVADKLSDSADELVYSEDELVCEIDVVVSIIKLICVLFFCGKDSVNEFIGKNCFSDTSSANVVENAPKIAMINKILRYMLAGY